MLLVIGLAVGALAGEAWARRAAAGKPAFKDGDPEAFWIWYDEGAWHLRVTTGKAHHSFHGVLRGEGLSALKPTRKALADKGTIQRDALRFEFDLYAGLDGFDWKSAGTCIDIELKLDGRSQPDKVHVGSHGEPPSGFPFTACQ